jgi:hypothetical protein
LLTKKETPKEKKKKEGRKDPYFLHSIPAFIENINNKYM